MRVDKKRGKKKNSLVIKLISGFLTTILLSCGTGKKTISVPMDTPETFSDSGVANVPDKWWTIFNDTMLNKLVDSALHSNFDLKTAWQRLHAAQAVVNRESSFLYPDLSVFAEAEKRWPAVENSEDLRLGLTSEYEVDLWGRIGSIVDAEYYRAKVTYADYQTAAISLSAEIVRTWYQLTENRNQLKLVEEQIETNEKVLKLIKLQFGSGQIRSVDILRQDQLLESTREQKISVESRIQVLENQMAVLLGRPPQEGFDYISKKLPDLPPVPATGLPVELVQRRPDVQSSYNLLLSADRDMAAAVSNQFPRLSFTASVSTAADNVDNLFEDWVGSIAGNLLAPIFRGGELSAEVDRTEAIKRQRLYQYGQTVLVAFREVEDALIQEKKQIEQINSIEKQLELARQTYEQLRIEYFNGMSDYLDVLIALTDEQQLRRDLLSEYLVLLEFRIALYRALAGGFETARESKIKSDFDM